MVIINSNFLNMDVHLETVMFQLRPIASILNDFTVYTECWSLYFC